MMDEIKKEKLERKGWKVGSVEEFLGLTRAESDFIDIKIALREALRNFRKEEGITQEKLAKLIKSSQSRVAKMEAGDPSVSIDLLLEAILELKPKEELIKYLAERFKVNTEKQLDNDIDLERHLC